MPNVQIDDLDMYYEVHGSGPPVVCILGLGSDLTQYTRIFKRLSRTHTVIAFDNRGSGRTGKPDIPYSMQMMAEDTVGLMDELNIDRASVVGISMGGRIALSLALNHPERVDRLILVCTGPHRFGRIRISLPMLMLLPLRKLSPFRSRYPQPRYAFLRQRDATFDFDVADQLSEIDLPTQIMHGVRDRTALYSNALLMHSAIKGSELATFRGGHTFFLLGEHRRFMRELTRFLAH